MVVKPVKGKDAVQSLPVDNRRADVDSAKYRSQSCIDLFEAIGEGNVDKVIHILETCAEDPKELLTKKDHQGLTPLRKAVALSQGETTRILVSYGADPALQGARDKLALHEAARLGQRTLIAPLLTTSCINAKDKDGKTPLHFAVSGRHLKTVQWLLFGGAEVDLKDMHEQTPLDLCRSDSDDPRDKQIFHMLQAQKFLRTDTLAPVLSCGYIEQKRLTKLGPDNGLMFVTSGLWSKEPQFIFVVQVLPENANPPIPLRQDEVFYSDLYRYKMMRSLASDEKRVKVFFAFLERFTHSELVLKLTSKTKYLGELAPTITRYLHDQYYINFLASCEIDLQNEGQFVLVRRAQLNRLTLGDDGALSCSREPHFKLKATDQTFPEPPPRWNETRRQKEWEEVQAMVQILQADKGLADGVAETGPNRQTSDANDDGQEDANQNWGETSKASDGKDRASSRTTIVLADDEAHLAEDDESGPQPGDILEWDEEDKCQDFFYISRGWGPYMETRRSLTPSTIMPRYVKDVEEPLIRACTYFYRVHHTSRSLLSTPMCQLPKSPGFVKTGTVLVFQRQELEENENESPDPDDKKEEFYMSDDGKHLHGWVWLNREKKRWSLLQFGIVNKRSRILFPINKLCTYVGVQLLEGEEEFEAESDESESEEESDDADDGEKAPAEGEEEEEEPKKKKKKKKKKGEGEDEGGEDDEGEPSGRDQESKKDKDKSENKSENNLNTNTNFNPDDPDERETIYQGLGPITSTFALGVDDEFQAGMIYRPEDSESAEDLGEPIPETVVTAPLKDMGAYILGPPLPNIGIPEEMLEQLLMEVAIAYRYRNHREAKILVFTRPRQDLCFDMLVEIVQLSDLDVRAEYRWSEHYRLVYMSSPFPTKTGRQFGFALEGTMTVITPADIHMRTIFFYSMRSNFLSYVVKRPSSAFEEQQQSKGRTGRRGTKRKEDLFKVESHEVDAHLEVTAYPRGTNMDGMDIASMEIKLTGPNLWKARHLEIREPDGVLTERVIQALIQDEAFTTDWWKVWIMLDYGEKAIDVEKVKQDWPAISKMMLEKWFTDNVDRHDRGIMHLFYVFETLRLNEAVDLLVAQLKNYKVVLESQADQPRQLDLLFHWVLRNKMTRSNLIRMVAEPQVMRPLSEQFLLRTAELLDPEELYHIGSLLDLEDNIINSILGEEYITDPLFKCFKLLTRCRHKKEEMVGYTLILLSMVQTMNVQEAQNFVSTETRRWMRTVTDTEPETCAKLENILPH